MLEICFAKNSVLHLHCIATMMIQNELFSTHISLIQLGFVSRELLPQEETWVAALGRPAYLRLPVL